MPYDLTGKTVVVTDATSGIGLAAAHLFVKSGAFVIGVGRSESRNEKAKDEILSQCHGGRIYPYTWIIKFIIQVKPWQGSYGQFLFS